MNVDVCMGNSDPRVTCGVPKIDMEGVRETINAVEAPSVKRCVGRIWRNVGACMDITNRLCMTVAACGEDIRMPKGEDNMVEAMAGLFEYTDTLLRKLMDLEHAVGRYGD